MKNITSRPLFIFEMANNHSGDVGHDLKMIKTEGLGKEYSGNNTSLMNELKALYD